MFKHYIALLVGITVLFMTVGCGEDKKETRQYGVVRGDLLLDVGDRKKISETNNDQNATDEDGGTENNGTNDGGSDDPVEEVQRVVSQVPEESVRENWYIRLTVTDSENGLSFKGAKLGEINEMNATSEFSLEALKPFGGSYIDIVFSDPYDTQGNYAVYFLPTDAAQEHRWRFTVRSSDADADILLSWRGVFVLDPYTDMQQRRRYREHLALHHTLWKQMKLIDVATQTEIPAEKYGRLQQYRFSMNGMSERIFEWVVETTVMTEKTENTEVGKPTIRQMPKQIKMISEPDFFDLDHPPVWKEAK